MTYVLLEALPVAVLCAFSIQSAFFGVMQLGRTELAAFSMRPCANAIFANSDAMPLIAAAYLETKVESGGYFGIATDAWCGSFAAPGVLYQRGDVRIRPRGNLRHVVAARGIRG